MAKHETDGHAAAINEDTLVQLGTVLRGIGKDGSQSPFADAVITKIRAGTLDKTFDSVKEAKTFIKELGYGATTVIIQLHLARPYLYATNTGNPLMGFENFTITLDRAIKSYSVVEMSTGKPATYQG